MARVLYGVSPIGLGHASRAVAVGEHLTAGGMDVKFATGGPAAEFLRSYGLDVEDLVREPVPRVEDGEMKNALAWYVRYWRGYRSTRPRIKRLTEQWMPSVVVGDEEFSSVSLALERGIPHAMITDELGLGFGRNWLTRLVERRVERWYRALQDEVSMLIIPDRGVDSANRRYVGPIVRKRTMDRDEALEAFSIPRRSLIILLAMSGAGIGGHLFEGARRAMLSTPGCVLVVMGNRGERISEGGVFDVGVVRDGQNLVAAADVVVSTAGKSTIDEAACFGTPLVTIPIRNHSEQEGNAAAKGYGAGDLSSLPELVLEKLGRRDVPADSAGARDAARLILSLV